MQIRLVAVVLLAFIVLPSTAGAQFRVPDPASGERFAVELGLMFWSPNPEIRLQTGALAAIGETEVDLVQEFGIDNKRFNEFRSVLKAGRKHKVRISHVLMEYHETAILQRTFIFGGQVYPISAPATADLEWRLWRFGYEWDFVAMDRAVIGFITELKYNDISSTLTAIGFVSETTEVSAPMPTIGGIARVYPHKQFSITVEYTGFKVPGFIGDKISDSLQGDDFDASQSDFDFYGTLSFGRHVGVQGGYRALTADYLADQDAGDLKMKGWYFGGLVRF
jgi:hypothetical protein